MAIKVSKAFKDISLSFKRHPVTNDITILSNEDAIKKAVINLVRTSIGERFFNSLIGSSVSKSLFELSSPEISILLEKEIQSLLQNCSQPCQIKKSTSEKQKLKCFYY